MLKSLLKLQNNASILCVRKCLFYKWKNWEFPANTATYLVIPEIPPKLSHKIYDDKGYVRLSTITPDVVFKEGSHLVMQYEAQLSNYLEKLKSLDLETNKANNSEVQDHVFSTLEALSYDLQSFSRILGVLHHIHDDSAMFKIVISAILQNGAESGTQRWYDPNLYKIVQHIAKSIGIIVNTNGKSNTKTVLQSIKKSSPQDQATASSSLNHTTSDVISTCKDSDVAIVTHYLHMFKQHGASLEVKQFDKVQLLNDSLTQAKSLYSMRVFTAEQLFGYPIRPSELDDAPPFLISQLQRAAAESQFGYMKPGSLLLTMQPAFTFNCFMECCNDRQLRRTAWFAKVQRAGSFTPQFVQPIRHAKIPNAEPAGNRQIIGQIRDLRHDIAQLLGYSNWAEKKFDGQMATSVADVLEMVDLYRIKYSQALAQELNAVKDLLKVDHLKWWDVPYGLRKLMSKAPCVLADSEMRPYFNLDNVLNRLFIIIGKLFDISIEKAELKIDPKIDQYVVLDQEKNILGELLVDIRKTDLEGENQPASSGVIGAVPLRDKFKDKFPISYLSIRLSHPSNHLSIFDLARLCTALGNSLQNLLTTEGKYWSVTGQNGLPLDAQNICGAVLRRLVFTPGALASLSGHVVNGNPMPIKLVDLACGLSEPSKGPICFSRWFSHYQFMTVLYESALDLSLCVDIKKHWGDLHSELQTRYFTGLLLPEKFDESMSNWTEVFVQDRESRLYSDVWSETIAVDIVNAFSEAGFAALDPKCFTGNSPLDRNVKSVCERFRRTYLTLGASVSPIEVFRRFRGRDPVRTVDIL